jgi:CubicO group peptidase (beta-lactamase class C family)
VGLNADTLQRMEELDGIIEPLLQAARIPGAGLAIVSGGKTVFARGFGYRDLAAQLSLTSQTVYPIASTTKAMNATLLGMLVDDGRLAWDAPVQQYLPHFRLSDRCTSAQVTVRDLLAMRTGLPRHDWVWMAQRTDRADIVRRLAFLELSASFRERFQYNNLTATTAGHIAEVVTGKTWDELLRVKLLEPLGMTNTSFGRPETENVSLSYHENDRRELILSQRLPSEVIAPSGGAIHSTVEDMAYWLSFNLGEGQVVGRQLISPRTLKEIHSPCVVAGADQGAPSPNAAYALGWFVDTHNGHARISHGGYVNDVQSSVMLFPDDDLGLVSFINFGPPRLASIINLHAFDFLMGIKTTQAIKDELAKYEKRIEETRVRIDATARVPNTSPSHALKDYTGSYAHAGYGRFEIRHCNDELILARNELNLPLGHWHYDAWVAKANELFAIDAPHAFDRASRLLFETNADGEIASFTVRLEPAVAPIRFSKQTDLLTPEK